MLLLLCSAFWRWGGGVTVLFMCTAVCAFNDTLKRVTRFPCHSRYLTHIYQNATKLETVTLCRKKMYTCIKYSLITIYKHGWPTKLFKNKACDISFFPNWLILLEITIKKHIYSK